ncbi:hypothetical protein FA15DRAFT_665909 [Coprinopsis marcescibilis]|uniref:Uncharacterized protein n=1 Tax=Coprinopsis marcescibilis TaxID=230819 RepID=A0A5C3L4E8_COPMA|nr:hypothetical protein FA15DRAFT_665909 [Coprinopsis marcescibilis]
MAAIELPTDAPKLTTRLLKPILVLLYISIIIYLPTLVLSVFPYTDFVSLIVTTIFGATFTVIFNTTFVVFTHKDLKRRNKLVQRSAVLAFAPAQDSGGSTLHSSPFKNTDRDYYYHPVRVPAIARLPAILVAFAFVVVWTLSAAYQIFIAYAQARDIRNFKEDSIRLGGNRNAAYAASELEWKRELLMYRSVLGALVVVQLGIMATVASLAVRERVWCRKLVVVVGEGDGEAEAKAKADDAAEAKVVGSLQSRAGEVKRKGGQVVEESKGLVDKDEELEDAMMEVDLGTLVPRRRT